MTTYVSVSSIYITLGFFGLLVTVFVGFALQDVHKIEQKSKAKKPLVK